MFRPPKEEKDMQTNDSGDRSNQPCQQTCPQVWWNAEDVFAQLVDDRLVQTRWFVANMFLYN